MKNKIYFTFLALGFCFIAKAIPYKMLASFTNSTNIKAEKLLEELNSVGFSHTTMAFTENKGQIYGYDGLPHPEVKFSFQQNGATIFLLSTGIAYQFTKMHYPPGYREWLKEKGDLHALNMLAQLQKTIRTETYRMDMLLVDANPNAEVTCENKSPDYVNYYNRNVQNVHTYNKIIYHNIYPGIDWIIYANANGIKYDFVVRPGADLNKIKMKFEHQEKLTLNNDGGFTIKNSLGSFTEKAPVSFQGGKSIGTRFIKDGPVISFALDNYDRHAELLIDPVLSWATYYGGTASDYGYSCVADALGNVYLAGQSQSSGNIASGGHQIVHGGLADAFLVKFNSSGVRQWATYYGGSGNDYGLACAGDAAGNIYVGGFTNSASGISSGGHQNVFAGGGNDAFLVKFNSSGVLQWATYYGGSLSDGGTGCITDGSGNVYLSGSTLSTANIASGGHQNTHGGVDDAFLVKFNGSGVLQWSTYYGGSGSDYGTSCTTDGSGNVYLAGYTQSTGGIGSGGHQNTFVGGNNDAFLVKFSANGVRQWGTYYGGFSGDAAFSTCTDGAGNVYLAGGTLSGSNIYSGGHQSGLNSFSNDAFLAKFNSSGVRLWGTYYGSPTTDSGQWCATDAAGNVYLAGTATSDGGIASGGHQNSHGGSNDAFLVKFNAAGTRQWGTYYGNTATDEGSSCTADAFGNIYLAGGSVSTSGIASGGHQNIHNGGSYDAFLAKFCSGVNQPSVISGTTSFCTGLSNTYSVALEPGATGYSWVLPAGWSGTPTVNSIQVTAPLSGIFSVAATGTCAASAFQTLSLTVNPIPSITVNSGTLCVGKSFTLVPSGAASYTYSTGSAIVIPSTGNTTYSVTGTSTAGCTSTVSALSNVTVYPLPTITVNSGTLCVGESFTITPSGAAAFTISGGTNVVTPLVNTQYTITGKSTEGCISATTAVTEITVHPLPVISAPAGSICAGQNFTIVPSGASTYTFSLGSPVVNPLTSTNFFVYGTSSVGCVAPVPGTCVVTVYQQPVVALNSGSICSGQSFIFSPTGGSTYSYTGGSSVVSPTTTSSYTVTGFSVHGCSATAVSQITVFSLPTLTINGGQGVLCTGESFTLFSSGASTYTWNGGVITETLLVSPSVTTTYSLTGTGASGCKNTASITVSVDPCAAIGDNELNGHLLIYPNPANGIFYIETDRKASIVIFNSLGQVLIQKDLEEGKNSVDLLNAASGVYVVTLKHSGKFTNIKLIKE